MTVEPADEADAYLLLERLRWNGAPDVCPHCATPGRCRFLSPADGRSRRTRTGSRSQRRVWKCGACRRQFSVLTATVLQGTKVGTLTWLAVLADLTSGRLPGSAAAMSGRYGVTPESARHLRTRMGAVEPWLRAVEPRLRAAESGLGAAESGLDADGRRPGSPVAPADRGVPLSARIDGSRGGSSVGVDERTEAVVRALLGIDATDAARIRDSTPSRRRPHPQTGPTADYR